VFAHAAILTNSYAGPEFAPIERQSAALAEGSDSQSESSAENLKLANSALTVIDFEVAAALSLCSGWNADWKADVYLVRTLERISGHLKALKAAQGAADQSRLDNSLSAPAEPSITNMRSILVMKPR